MGDRPTRWHAGNAKLATQRTFWQVIEPMFAILAGCATQCAQQRVLRVG